MTCFQHNFIVALDHDTLLTVEHLLPTMTVLEWKLLLKLPSMAEGIFIESCCFAALTSKHDFQDLYPMDLQCTRKLCLHLQLWLCELVAFLSDRCVVALPPPPFVAWRRGSDHDPHDRERQADRCSRWGGFRRERWCWRIGLRHIPLKEDSKSAGQRRWTAWRGRRESDKSRQI